jgi:hypothetical protein
MKTRSIGKANKPVVYRRRKSIVEDGILHDSWPHLVKCTSRKRWIATACIGATPLCGII